MITMRVKNILTACISIVFGTYALTSQANNDRADHIWMPKKPGTVYWQAPAQPAAGKPQAEKYTPPQTTQAPIQQPPIQQRVQQPAQNNTYKPSAPVYRPPQRMVYYPAPYTGPNTGRANIGRAVPPPPAGPYRSTVNLTGDPASAFNLPGQQPSYNPGSNYNQFRRPTGPGRLMNPSR